MHQVLQAGTAEAPELPERGFAFLISIEVCLCGL